MKVFQIASILGVVVVGWCRISAEEVAVPAKAGFVIPLLLEMGELTRLGADPGSYSFVEVEYYFQPDGSTVFEETAEQVWWLRDRPLLLLGSTGSALPASICNRKLVFIQVWFDGQAVWTEPQAVFPRKDGFQVPSDSELLGSTLKSRVTGIDAPYLSQVSNYLAQNVATLDVRGDTLTIDTDGWFGGLLDTAGFRMVAGAADGRVLTCNADGVSYWSDAGSGLALPYTGTASTPVPLFSLQQGDVGGGIAVECTNPTSSQPGIYVTGMHAGASILATNNYPSTTISNEGVAGYFRATNPNSVSAALFAESFSDIGGSTLSAAHFGTSGSAAMLTNFTNTNNDPAALVATFGPGSALEAISFDSASGIAAKFRHGNPGAAGDVLVAESTGAGAAISGKGQSTGTAVTGQNTGTGVAGEFAVINASNTNPALKASTNGLGSAGLFESSEATNVEPAIKSISHGRSVAVYAVNDHPSSFVDHGAAGHFEVTNPAGINVAIRAKSVTDNATIYVQNTGRAGVAAIFESTSPDPDNANAAVSIVNTANSNTSLFAQNHGTGPAGVFSGDVNVYGTLSKTSGSFRIDHPLDPENKYLQHSFVESPDMMNLYNGNVTLDRNGRAWITLPDWFEVLNRSFRYQLTAIGRPAPNLYIAREIQDLRFEIAGGHPHQKVSWMVTGIRQDPYAIDHPIETEIDKPMQDRGKYVYPQGYGADRASSIITKPAQPIQTKTD